jgi:hypothetical protein
LWHRQKQEREEKTQAHKRIRKRQCPGIFTIETPPYRVLLKTCAGNGQTTRINRGRQEAPVKKDKVTFDLSWYKHTKKFKKENFIGLLSVKQQDPVKKHKVIFDLSGTKKHITYIIPSKNKKVRSPGITLV